MKTLFFKKEKGFTVIILAIIIMSAALIITLSFSAIALHEKKIVSNSLKSLKSYYTAEAGIEDIILRINKGIDLPSVNPSNLTVGDGIATRDVGNLIVGNREITSLGNFDDRIRKVKVVITITTNDASFYYGIQVGDLGLQMESNAVVHGNIFSNGTITGDSNAKIYGDAISAGDSGQIKSVEIKDDEGGGSVWAKHLENCTIDGDAHYTTIDKNSSVGGTSYAPEAPLPKEDMPISQDTINNWKNEAVAGGTIPDYFLGGNDHDSLGPVKVNGDMSLDSNAILTLTGTIWVTGDLILNSNVIVQLNPGYGPHSGVIVVDGKISVDSNVLLCGSEGYKNQHECNPSASSYLMLLSTNNSNNPGNPAISAESNTETAILYAANGFITLNSNADLREATGYGVYMSSNAEVNYETGLTNVHFSSGPGGGWRVISWEETI